MLTHARQHSVARGGRWHNVDIRRPQPCGRHRTSTTNLERHSFPGFIPLSEYQPRGPKKVICILHLAGSSSAADLQLCSEFDRNRVRVLDATPVPGLYLSGNNHMPSSLVDGASFPVVGICWRCVDTLTNIYNSPEPNTFSDIPQKLFHSNHLGHARHNREHGWRRLYWDSTLCCVSGAHSDLD